MTAEPPRVAFVLHSCAPRDARSLGTAQGPEPAGPPLQGPVQPFVWGFAPGKTPPPNKIRADWARIAKVTGNSRHLCLPEKASYPLDSAGLILQKMQAGVRLQSCLVLSGDRLSPDRGAWGWAPNPTSDPEAVVTCTKQGTFQPRSMLLATGIYCDLAKSTFKLD